VHTYTHGSKYKSNDGPECLTALVGKELQRYDIDIAAIYETHLADEGKHCKAISGYTFFWKGKPQNECRIHRVGFAIKTSLVTKLNLHPASVDERIS